MGDTLEHQCNRTLAYLGHTDLEVFFTSPAWRKIQTRFLARNPRCVHCGRVANLARITAYTIKTL
jgi:hypothetical protein